MSGSADGTPSGQGVGSARDRDRGSRGPVGALLLPAALAALLACGADALRAQEIVGKVLDEVRETPVAGAVVSLVTFTGETDAQTIADPEGRFRIAPTREGEYYLQASRLGYETGRTPLLKLEMTGTAPVDVLLRPAPVGLEGLSVTVDRLERIRRELRFAGVTPEQLGQRFVTRAQFESLLPRADVGNILEWSNIAGIGFLRTEDLSGMSDDIGLCVYLERARNRITGGGRCALPVLDGVPVPGTLIQAVNPWDVEAIAVLTPSEAGLLYGGLGAGGALLVWRQGSR